MPPRGGQLQHHPDRGGDTAFQVMPPRGGQRAGAVTTPLTLKFQVMPPRGGQLTTACCNYAAWMSFKSCPREGGNFCRVAVVCRVVHVSSHAPARGATDRRIRSRRPYCCFKSCPREGGNFFKESAKNRRFCFKSCPREGGNLLAADVLVARQKFQVMPPRGGQQQFRTISIVFYCMNC